MLKRFFRWWFGQLAELLPAGLRGGRGRGAGLLLVDETAEGVVFRLRQRTRVRELGDATGIDVIPARLRRRLPRVLVRPLPRGVLLRELELPAAAAADPGSALELNMDRHVPFHADDVHYAFDVAPGRGAQQPLSVRLAVVPRERLERLLAPLEGLGLHPCHELEVDGESVGFAFEPPARSRAVARLVTVVLVAVNVALLGLLVAMPWQRQTEALAAMEAQLDHAREAALSVSAKYDRLAAERARLDFLSAESRRQFSVVLLLEELSRLLPDDSWLIALQVNERGVRMQGYASRASSLIGVLQQSSLVGSARFGSPIVRDPATGKERFDLHVDMTPTGGDSSGERTVARAGARE